MNEIPLLYLFAIGGSLFFFINGLYSVELGANIKTILWLLGWSLIISKLLSDFIVAAIDQRQEKDG